jgi:hypothetical protein
MERAITALLHADRSLTDDDVHGLTLGDLPAGTPETAALLRSRAAVGLPVDHAAPVLVRADGSRPSAELAPLELRRARAVRISVDGNAHFCRGLLRTRYPGAESEQTARPSVDDRPVLPLEVLS